MLPSRWTTQRLLASQHHASHILLPDMTVNASSMRAPQALREASPALVMLGRAGYAAKGAVYIVIGTLAARAALGKGGTTTDSKGALNIIGDGPFGTVALVLIGAGLLGYMAWRLVAAVTDAEGEGDKPTKLAVRAAQAGRGLLYGALGLEALRVLRNQGKGESDAAQSWSAKLLELPHGDLLVGAGALGMLGYAGYQLYRAISEKKVRKHLDLAQGGAAVEQWTVRLGRFGIAARAVVFAMIGVLLFRAAMRENSREAGGIADSLRELASMDHGWLVLSVVAIGLVAYGLYEIATARYRRMRAVG